MNLTPQLKGQLTKALNKSGEEDICSHISQRMFNDVRRVFGKILPAQQAKHATRKFLAEKTAQ